MKKILAGMILLFALPAFAGAGEIKPLKPAAKDKCPVCGMFVAKYPDFIAQIIFKDGSYAMFDGSKDMFKYYLNMKTYHPSKKSSDIDSVYVTDYYSLKLVDGMKAYYVIGSDINGPMGRELIPFEKEGDAKEFLKDHKGKKLTNFSQVTAPMLRELD
jgi:nitrous oxide reductase accessory protein NosL